MRKSRWIVGVSALLSACLSVGVVIDETKDVAPSVKSNAVEIVTRLTGESFTNATWRMAADIRMLWTNAPVLEIGIWRTNDSFTVRYVTTPETNFLSLSHDNQALGKLYFGRKTPQTVMNCTNAMQIAARYAARFGVSNLLDSQEWGLRQCDFSQGKWSLAVYRILSCATQRVYADFGIDISFYDDEDTTLKYFHADMFQIRDMPTNGVLTAAQGRANADACLARLGKWPATGAEFITNRLVVVFPNDTFVKPRGEDFDTDCWRPARLIWCNYYSKPPEIPGWRRPQIPMFVYVDAVTGEICGGAY